MLICVQAPFTRTFDNKDRPWTPAVRRVAEPVMLRITILLNNAGTTTSASDYRHLYNLLVRTPQHPPSLCVVDYPLFLVA